MKYEWQRKVFGRRAGQVEDLDETKEPRLKTWLAAGLLKDLGAAKKTPPAEPAIKPAKQGDEVTK